MGVALGINPITWTNDDVPELGGDTPLETCLGEMHEAGYTGTELGTKYPREPGRLGEMLDRHGLALVSGWWDGRILEQSVEDEMAAMSAHLNLLRDLGAELVVYADTSAGRHDAIWRPISDRPTLGEDDWSSYGAKLTELADRMAEFGVAMAFHHHMGTIVETDTEVDRLMGLTGSSVGLLFDSGHSAFAGGDPVALAERHAERIVHVHCKDVRGPVLEESRRTDTSFMQAVLDGIFTVPGDGAIDFPAIMSALAQVDYSGWLVVEAEQDPAKAHPLTYATMGRQNLERMARDAGLHVYRTPSPEDR